MNRKIKCHWHQDKNLGDCLSPIILKNFGYRVQYSAPDSAELIFMGSILDKLSPNYKGVILGTGFIRAETKIDLTAAKILGLRGALTRDMLQCQQDLVLGDPGLLSPLLIRKVSNEKYTLGIVPHYVDQKSEVVEILKSNLRNAALIIDVRKNPVEVIEEIARCNYVVSSSLHGLVVADSLSIPNLWVKFSEKVIGNDFKFNDYYSIYGKRVLPYYPNGKENLDDLLDRMRLNGEIVFSVQLNLLKMLKMLKEII